MTQPSADLDAMRAWAANHIATHVNAKGIIGPDLVIDDDQVERWFVVPRNGTCNVYLHRFLKSDNRVLHDHEYDNVSWILDGEYLEHFADQSITRCQGERIERVAEIAHRVELVTGPVTTLFVTGPRRRDWGFHTRDGWVRWQDFVGASDSYRVWLEGRANT